MNKLSKKISHIIPANARRKIISQINNFIYSQKIKKFYSSINFENNMPLFRAVEIETLNRCNGKCSFCPVNVNEKQRPYAKMNEELFRKIITDLEELHYSGIVSLFSNNEPFLDERIPDFILYAKEHLPNAYHSIYTNGSMLTINILEKILPALDKLIIDNYSDGKTVNMNTQEIIEWMKDHDYKNKIEIALRKENEILTSRGGLAPNKKNLEVKLKEGCFLPFKQIVIRPTGEVSLCCNDALGIYTLGDLRLNTLKEIWYSENYLKIRRELYKNGRENLRLCRECDSRTYVNF